MIRFVPLFPRFVPASVFVSLWLVAGPIAAVAAETAGDPAAPASAETGATTAPSESPAAAPARKVDSPAPAQVQLADTLPGGADFPLVRAVGGLGLVLSLIVGGFIAVRRFAPQCLRGGAPEKTLRVLETLSMGDKRSLALVQVGDQRLLIGSTAQQISVLSPLAGSWPSTRDSGVEPADHPTPAPAAGRSFRDSFRSLYETERGRRSPDRVRAIPADIRAKMKQLRDGLENS